MASKSEAQKRADKNWTDKNREHANYLRGRSSARSFIRNRATEEDLKELELLIIDRRKEL